MVAKYTRLMGILIVSFVSLVGAQTYEMRTVVRDFVTTEWTLACPDGGVLDLSKVDLTDEGIKALFECFNDIESQVGVQIQSKTVVKDFVVESDEIVSTSALSAEQVDKIKNIIDQHRIPVNAFPASRARIQTVLLNGAIDSFLIDIGKGCVIDLTNTPLDPQVMQELIQLIQQIESENGVHITSATTVKDGSVEKDRVLQITHLTDDQIQRILQFFASKNIAVIPFQKFIPVHMTGTLFYQSVAIPFDVSGEILIQAPPMDPQTGQQPLELMGMQLVSADPLGVFVELGFGPEPPLMVLDPVHPDGTLHFFFGPLPTLAFGNVGPQRDFLIGHPDAGPEFEFLGAGAWPNYKAINLFSPSIKPLAQPDFQNPNPQPGPVPVVGHVQITCFKWQLPLRMHVIQGGLGD